MDFHHALFWLCTVVTGIAESLILRSALFPVSGPPGAGSDTATPGSLRVPESPRGVEVLWGLIPALGLAVVFAVTWRVLW